MTELPDLTDLREMLDVPILKLPIGGKVYHVRPCSAKVWLKLQEINSRFTKATAAAEAREAAIAAGEAEPEVEDATPDDGPELSDTELFKLSLGPTFAELVDSDDVTQQELERAGVTAYYWQLGNSAVAAAMWETAGKAPEPQNRAARRAGARTRTSTAAASTTRKPASTSGTTSRRKRTPNKT